MNIKNFNAGDIIVRTAPGEMKEDKYNDNLGITTQVTSYQDTSYIGEPVKLLDDGMDSIRYAAYTSKSNGVFNYMIG